MKCLARGCLLLFTNAAYVGCLVLVLGHNLTGALKPLLWAFSCNVSENILLIHHELLISKAFQTGVLEAPRFTQT